jgi:hypothetical protein
MQQFNHSVELAEIRANQLNADADIFDGRTNEFSRAQTDFHTHELSFAVQEVFWPPHESIEPAHK